MARGLFLWSPGGAFFGAAFTRDLRDAEWSIRIATGNPDAMRDLRSWGADQRGGVGGRTPSDRELIRYAAIGLTDGIFGASQAARFTGGSTQGGQRATEKAPLRERKVEPARTLSQNTVTPAALFPREEPDAPVREAPVKPASEIDVDRQVASLLSAAESGAAFCEQCEKARERKTAATRGAG